MVAFNYGSIGRERGEAREKSKLTSRPVTSQYFLGGKSDGGASTDESTSSRFDLISRQL